MHARNEQTSLHLAARHNASSKYVINTGYILVENRYPKRWGKFWSWRTFCWENFGVFLPRATNSGLSRGSFGYAFVCVNTANRVKSSDELNMWRTTSQMRWRLLTRKQFKISRCFFSEIPADLRILLSKKVEICEEYWLSLTIKTTKSMLNYIQDMWVTKKSTQQNLSLGSAEIQRSINIPNGAYWIKKIIQSRNITERSKLVMCSSGHF